MKKIIIIGLSLFLGTQAFAFGMNATGSASVEENQLHGELEVVVPDSDCVATLEYAPVCASINGEGEVKTFSNGGHANVLVLPLFMLDPVKIKRRKLKIKAKLVLGLI